MVTLITGGKGSGKTKQLIQLVNEAAEVSDGNVVCVEQTRKLIYDITSRARLIAADDYAVAGYDAFYGFLCGICAGDHDITDVFVDTTLRIGGRDYRTLAAFLEKVARLSGSLEKRFLFTVSAPDSELPEEIFAVCEKFS
jgi:energy-coupling factor transporter ATP-binding protein EcfA2